MLPLQDVERKRIMKRWHPKPECRVFIEIYHEEQNKNTTGGFTQIQALVKVIIRYKRNYPCRLWLVYLFDLITPRPILGFSAPSLNLLPQIPPFFIMPACISMSLLAELDDILTDYLQSVFWNKMEFQDVIVDFGLQLNLL